MIERCFVYILKCKDSSLYTGWTLDLNRRLSQHNKGQASKYTRSRRPVKIVYYELVPSRGEALSREYRIKQKNRKKKLELIENKNFSFIDTVI